MAIRHASASGWSTSSSRVLSDWTMSGPPDNSQPPRWIGWLPKHGTRYRQELESGVHHVPDEKETWRSMQRNGPLRRLVNGPAVAVRTAPGRHASGPRQVGVE